MHRGVLTYLFLSREVSDLYIGTLWMSFHNNDMLYLDNLRYALDQGVSVAAVDVEASQTKVTDSELDFTITSRTLQKRVSKANNHIQVPSGG